MSTPITTSLSPLDLLDEIERSRHASPARTLLASTSWVAAVGFGVLSVIGASGPHMQLLALAMCTVVPGAAVVVRSRVDDPLAMVSVTTVLSMAIVILGSWLMIFGHWWHPVGALQAVAALVAVAHTPYVRPTVLLPAVRSVVPHGRSPSQMPPGWWVAMGLGIGAWAGDVTGAARLPSLLPYTPPGVGTGWWLGLTMAVVTFLVAAHRNAAWWVLAACTAAICVMIHATAPLLYGEARYAWTFKHLGVADYIRAHGTVRTSVDVYHNWPGFFGWIATFTEAARIERATTLARWWPLGMQALTAMQVWLMARSIWRQPARRACVVTVYLLGAWIGQEYFSPQSFGFLATVAITAWCLRWLSANDLRWGRISLMDDVTRLSERKQAQRAVCALVLVVYAAILVSHQLSPFMLPPFLIGAIWSCGLRPKWLVGAVTGLLALHTWLRWDVVSSQGGVSDVGSVGSNIEPPSVAYDYVTPSPVLKFNIAAGALIALVITFAAIVGWVLMRRRRWPAWGIATMGVGAPVVSVVMQRYGGEGVLRAYLFALPWLAVLASACLGGSLLPDGRPRLGPMRLATCSLLAAGLTGAFAVSFFARDPVNAINASEVRAQAFFERVAPYDATLLEPGAAGMPVRVSARYAEFNWYFRADLPFPPLRDAQQRYDAARDLAVLERVITEDYDVAEWYLSFSAVAASASDFYGLMSREELDRLEQEVRQDPLWGLAYSDGSTRLYRFRWEALPAPA